MTHIQDHQTEPVIPTDVDLLASFRAYIRAAEAEHRAHMSYWRGKIDAPELQAASAAERTAREAHETALRAVCER